MFKKIAAYTLTFALSCANLYPVFWTDAGAFLARPETLSAAMEAQIAFKGKSPGKLKNEIQETINLLNLDPYYWSANNAGYVDGKKLSFKESQEHNCKSRAKILRCRHELKKIYLTNLKENPDKKKECQDCHKTFVFFVTGKKEGPIFEELCDFQILEQEGYEKKLEGCEKPEDGQEYMLGGDNDPRYKNKNSKGFLHRILPCIF